MKIAVPSNDGLSVSEHFGRSAFFMIFETDKEKIVGEEIRRNNHTPHALGECDHGQNSHGHHSHSAMVRVLADCAVVLCRGIGWRASEDLKKGAIEPFILDRPFTVREAVSHFISGKLLSTGACCMCHEQVTGDPQEDI